MTKQLKSKIENRGNVFFFLLQSDVKSEIFGFVFDFTFDFFGERFARSDLVSAAVNFQRSNGRNIVVLFVFVFLALRSLVAFEKRNGCITVAVLAR